MTNETPAARILSRMRAQRQSWVDIAPGKRVQIMRPPEAELPDFVTTTDDGRYTLHAELRHVHKYTTGWSGFTEADLIGAAGSSDPIDFTPELWLAVVEDQLEWLRAVAQALLDAVIEHRTRREADAKN